MLFASVINEFSSEPRFPVAGFVENIDTVREEMERRWRLVREGADLVLVGSVNINGVDDM